MKIYALDIGGSSIKHAVVDTILKSNYFLISPMTVVLKSNNFIDLHDTVIDLVTNILKTNIEISTIAISTTGGVSKDGIVINGGHFLNYSNISWKEIIQKKIGINYNVFIANDGKAAAWAEYTRLDKKPFCFVHYVIGTGIGGAIIINNTLYVGEDGFAGYLGHIKVVNNHLKCSCGKTGCIETISAAPRIVQNYLDRTGKGALSEKLSLLDVVLASKRGDLFATEALSNAGKYLGMSISNVMNILNPGIITIGGGIMVLFDKYKNDFYFNALYDDAMVLSHKRTSEKVKIQKAHFGNDGGLIGVAWLAEASI